MNKRRVICILLIITLILPIVFIPSAPLVHANPAAVMINDVPYSDAFALKADPQTNIPDFADTLNENGRLWTDKSVNFNNTAIFDIAGKQVGRETAEADEFLITLSALSQSFSVIAVEEPTDTVFVIDVSASMYINKLPNGDSRIKALITALNEAIGMLMEANPHNRVAVVAYGGSSGVSKVYPALSLDRYDFISDHKYFSLLSAARIQINPNIPDAMLLSAQSRIIPVEGGTSTQRGIYAGASILLDIGNNTTHTETPPSGPPVTVTRKPNIVLMTDGSPTLGWTDYKFENPSSNTDNGFDCGNANNFDMGISLLTVLTAAYMKQQVQNHYYKDNNAKPVGFYTIGLDVDSILATASMDPAGVTPTGVFADQVKQSFSGNVYNMRNLLDRFIAGQVVEFPALVKSSASTRSLRTIQNTGGIMSYDYPDNYFSATDNNQLNDAFNKITSAITSHGNYSVRLEVGWNPDLDSFLVFSDVLGQDVEFRDIKGLWYENNRYDGHIFAANIQAKGTVYNDFIDIIREHQSEDNISQISLTEAANLLDSNILAGKPNGGLYYNSNSDFSNKISYYAKADRSYVSSYFDSLGQPLAPPTDAMAKVDIYTMMGDAIDPVTGNQIDLMNISIHVLTALEDGDFECVYSNGTELVRKLEKGDQVVRWYIPASLIPLRYVETLPGGNNEVVVAKAVPIRLIYSVGLKEGTSGSDYYYTNRHDTSENRSAAFFQPAAANPYYQNHTADDERQKSANLTETAGYSFKEAHFGSGSDLVLVNLLGNNGRWEMPYTSLKVVKEWDSYLAQTPFMKPEYIQLYGNNKPIGDPVLFDPAAGIIAPGPYPNVALLYQWTKLPLFELEADVNNQAVFVEYTVREGELIGGQFVPYGASFTDFLIHYADPKWNTATGTWKDARITNIYKYNDIQLLEIEKEFIGILPDEVLGFTNETSIEFEITAYQSNNDVLFTGTLFYPQNFTNDSVLVGSSKEAAYYIITEKYHNVPNYKWTVEVNGTPAALVGVDHEINLSGSLDDVVRVKLTNIYTPAAPPELSLTKLFSGSISATDNYDILFEIEGFKDAQKTNRIFYDTATVTTGVPLNYNSSLLTPGYYTITEYGAEQAFSNANPFDIHEAVLTVDASGVTLDSNNGFWLNYGDHAQLELTNTYEKKFVLPTARLTLEKKFDFTNAPGLTAASVSDISFLIVGQDGADQIYRKTVSYSDFENGLYELTHLPAGNYTVSESGGLADEHSLEVLVNGISVPAMPIWQDSLAENEIKHIVFENKYDLLIAPPSLRVRKSFTGLSASEIPAGIEIHIDGPGSFYEVLDLTELLNDNCFFTNLALGDYVITESGALVTGFDLTTLPNVGGSPGHIATVTIGDMKDEITVTINNQYTKIPPPTADLNIEKVFTGNPSPDPNFSFLVIGQDSLSNEIFRQKVLFSDFTNDTYELTGLPIGDYSVTETGGVTEGYDLTVVPSPVQTVVLNANGTETLIFENQYTPVPSAASPSLRIREFFHGISNSEIPLDIEITISSNTGFNHTLDYDAIINELGDFTGLDAGIYTIMETSDRIVAGYDLYNTSVLAMVPIIVTLAGTEQKTVVIHNYYQQNVIPPTAKLNLTKNFILPPSLTTASLSELTFTVLGTNLSGDEIYRRLVSYPNDFNGDICEIIDLPAGYYTVTESGGFADGYSFSTSVDGSIFNDSYLADGETKEAEFTNEYQLLPSITPPALRVRKAFHGLNSGEIPAGLQVLVEGPGGFSEIIDLPELNNDNAVFFNLPAGTYTISEINPDVPGFKMSARLNSAGNPLLPATVDMTGVNDEITVVIDNYYEHETGSLFIEKNLAGLAADWNVGTGTAFTAMVKDIAANNYLYFTYQPSSNTYLAVGNSHSPLPAGAVELVEFSVDHIANLEGLWSDRFYRVEETAGNGYVTAYSGNNVIIPDNAGKTVAVINTYGAAVPSPSPSPSPSPNPTPQAQPTPAGEPEDIIIYPQILSLTEAANAGAGSGSPATGDNSNTLLWSFIFCISLAGLIWQGLNFKKGKDK